MIKGKNYANRKCESERPVNDFYQTPKCLTWELISTNYLQNHNIKTILDPCCGKYAISNILVENGFRVYISDLIYGQDFLSENYSQNIGKICDSICMNPPFKLFNKFVEKAKNLAPIVCCIGKPNFFGAHDRNISGLWQNLEYVYIFDRQIAYDKPFREDGKVDVGMMITGWFIWNKNYVGEPKIKVIDMQKYILRGRKDD